LCAHVQVSKQNESLSLSFFASLEGSRRRSYLARTFAAVYHCKHQHKCERMPHVVAVTVKPGGPSIVTCLDDAESLAGYSVWKVEINQPLQGQEPGRAGPGPGYSLTAPGVPGPGRVLPFGCTRPGRAGCCLLGHPARAGPGASPGAPG